MGFWKKKPKETEHEPSESQPEPVEEEPPKEDKKDDEKDDKDDKGAEENLDVEGHWNLKYIDFEKFMNAGGQRAINRGRKGEKNSPDTITMEDVITRAEQDILGIKLGMLPMKEARQEGKRLLMEFRALREAVGSRQYAKLIVAMRYSCTFETKIGFHEPSFSEWDILNEEWVDDEYRRRLQGIDVASADWKTDLDMRVDK